MEELIGKTIKRLYISRQKDLLKVEVADEAPLLYYINGDCCSFSWIEHITMCNLFDSKVLSVDSIALGSEWPDEYTKIQTTGLNHL
jgi:hypothetical protein